MRIASRMEFAIEYLREAEKYLKEWQKTRDPQTMAMLKDRYEQFGLCVANIIEYESETDLNGLKRK